MAELLNAKDMQDLLQVDRSTIYRMAESGRLPAIKIGKQWRFPVEQVEEWLGTKVTAAPQLPPAASSGQPSPTDPEGADKLAKLLPMDCVQQIQETYAELLGVMLVVTDLEGNPITEVSNSCNLFNVVSKVPGAIQKCIQSWHKLGSDMRLEPKFSRSHLGLLCTRGMIRVGSELKGMVVAGCVAPPDWPPSPADIQAIAAEFGVKPELIRAHIEETFYLSGEEKERVIAYIQRIANIVAHIVHERSILMGRLEAIAALTKL